MVNNTHGKGLPPEGSQKSVKPEFEPVKMEA
jgi:hypothetical protein